LAGSCRPAAAHLAQWSWNCYVISKPGKDKGVDLFLHQQGLDTSTTAGKAMFQILGVFAEFERGIIKERVNAGLARARANGTKLGRGNRKDGKASKDEKRWGMRTAAMEEKIKTLHKSGVGMLKIGRELGVGTGFVQRIIGGLPIGRLNESTAVCESANGLLRDVFSSRTAFPFSTIGYS
jgi:DNA invertase Pin-like site-specific DNA recombinase